MGGWLSRVGAKVTCWQNGVLLCLGIMTCNGIAGPITLGRVYPIREPDLLAVLTEKANHLSLRAPLTDIMAQRLRDWPVVITLPRAKAVRQWTVIPEAILPQAWHAPDGTVVPAGTAIPLLRYFPLAQSLIFVDVTDKRQRRWLLNRAKKAPLAKIITTGGDIQALQTALQRPVFIDGDAALIRRFGIKVLPAVAQPMGEQVQLTEGLSDAR